MLNNCSIRDIDKGNEALYHNKYKTYYVKGDVIIKSEVDEIVRISGLDEQTIMQVDVVQNFINTEIEFANKIREIVAPTYLEQVRVFRDTVQRLSDGLASFANFQMTYLANELANTCREVYKTYEPLYNISNALQVFNVQSMYIANMSLSEDEVEIDQEDIKLANEKIVTEILLPDNEKCIDTERSAIIKLSPINDNLLRYLSENPQELYKLSGGDFEEVMAEIYSKLGYDVERTKATRDGGKDLIIRKREILGDFIYYVECKKYAATRPIGVGIVRDLVGTINTDRVNGGIIVTTSFFSADAINFVTDNNFNYQIQMQNYDVIRSLLNRVGQ